MREAFDTAGFTEVSIRSFDVQDDGTALGVVRYDGVPMPLGPRRTWFTFGGEGPPRASVDPPTLT